MLDFVDITKDNVHLHCRFDKDFENELDKFQNKIYPDNSDFFTVLISNGLLRWSFLFYGGKLIGAIWLEKEHSCLPVATLGIFIADKNYRCKGIGERAIKEYIARNKKDLKLKEVNLQVRKENIRAKKCYEKCGFAAEKEYELSNGQRVIDMSKSV